MALNIKKTEVDEDAEYKKLMCSVPGCKNRWSVHIDVPRCSYHQWGPKKPTTKQVELKQKTQQWYDKENF